MSADVNAHYSRPTTGQYVELHILVVPSSRWNSATNNLLSDDLLDVTKPLVSAGFLRMHPENDLRSLRREIDAEIGGAMLPQDFVFLKSVGRFHICCTRRQESQLKIKYLVPEGRNDGDLYLLDPPLDFPSKDFSSVNASRVETGDSLDFESTNRRFARSSNHSPRSEFERYPPLPPIQSQPEAVEEPRDRETSLVRGDSPLSKFTQTEDLDNDSADADKASIIRERQLTASDVASSMVTIETQTEELVARQPSPALPPLSASPPMDDIPSRTANQSLEPVASALVPSQTVSKAVTKDASTEVVGQDLVPNLLRREEHTDSGYSESSARGKKTDHLDADVTTQNGLDNKDESSKNQILPESNSNLLQPTKLNAPSWSPEEERYEKVSSALQPLPSIGAKYDDVVQSQSNDSSRELQEMKAKRSELEKRREELVKKVKSLQSQSTLKRNAARDVWKKKYFEEKKKTPPLEEQSAKLRGDLEQIHKRIMSSLESVESRKSLGVGGKQGSEQDNMKLRAMKLKHDIDDSQRKLENLKLKLAAEMKLRSQAETELRALRAELTQKKINVTLTRNTAPPDSLAPTVRPLPLPGTPR